jgi:gluconate 2-dehydrogenase gamma chain
MDRRKILRCLASAAALPAIRGNFYDAFRFSRESLPTGGALKTLTADQNATVAAMADMMIPRTETPGALDVRVPEFIDLILSDWYDDRERAIFVEGLARVDEFSKQKFGKNFVELSADQRTEILRFLGDEMASEMAHLATGPRGYHGGTPEPHNNFYLMFRRLVLIGYFTSEDGSTQQLHFQVIPDHPDACAPLAKDKLPGEKQQSTNQ